MIQPTGSSLSFSGVSISNGTGTDTSSGSTLLLGLENPPQAPAFILSDLKSGVPATPLTGLSMPV